MNIKGTTYTKKEDDVKQFLLFDADGQVLGRLASRVAAILRGKHKPGYNPSVDMGDHVIVVNASKIRLTGKKEDSKVYIRHTMYPGGLKETKFRDLKAKRPETIIREAVRGMLPKNTLGKLMLRKLKVYAGPEHPHNAQKPVKVEAVK